ncbi:glycoside hydrolase family 6 protein [Cellulomonas sp. DKR-3]|uniref:Glucanase n=1 Tax=Cellulomonas fulva TaxID=2835530 RepID=A0ABS5U2F4_9CELL|nr:glycoside hydrolase family 6 protein [Cellulomonas fulva]MBT0995575.1 glycoside hydrolase family 6 protein [Cellulomonas fulva]
MDRTTQAHDAVAAARAAGRTGVATSLQVIASAPQAMWVGDWYPTASVRSTVASYVRKARAAARTPQLVLYAIPGRDCGSYSGGGLDETTYPRWVAQVALGLRDGAVGGRSQALVVLEPDSLMMDCGSAAFDARRNRLMSDATARLAATGAWVYLDAGHSNWRTASDTASRLRAAGVARARGFFTNVSNYNATSREKSYAQAVARRLAASGLGAGHRHYVVDTSRNGTASADGQWCNPRGQGLGVRPRAVQAGYQLDALLWVKHPGESDGTCNGGPGAGQWWEDVALELVRNRVR